MNGATINFILLSAFAMFCPLILPADEYSGIPVRNADFEIIGPRNHPAGWKCHFWAKDLNKEGLSVLIDDKEKKSGKSSVRFSASGNTSVCQAICKQRIPVKGSSTYKISFWIKSDFKGQKEGRNTSFINQLRKDGKVQSQPTFYLTGKNASENWEKLEFNLETKADTFFLEPIFRLRVETPAKKTCSLWIDEFSIELLNRKTPEPLKENESEKTFKSIGISGAPKPGTDNYTKVYGDPNEGNVIPNYSFKLLKKDLASEIRASYAKLKNDQPIEWIGVSRGNWRKSNEKLLVTGTSPDFFLRTRGNLAVDGSKSYRASVCLKGNDVNAAFIQIVWLNIYYDHSSKSVKQLVLGQSNSPVLKGSFDFSKLEARGQPPENCQFARLNIYADTGEKGKLWADNALFYGMGDDEMEFLYSQAGFEADGYKDIAIRTKNKFSDIGKFRIYRKGKTETELERTLKYLGKGQWGRHYYAAEFSSFNKAGDFCLEASFKNISRRTEAFPIKKGLYLDLFNKGLHWFCLQRCNANVPGWHEADFMDDGLVYEDSSHKKIKGHFDLTGGWHDAADMNKWTGMEGFYSWAIAYAENIKKQGNTETSDPYSEAAWGVKYLVNAKKPYKQKGVFAQWVKKGKNIPGAGNGIAHGRYCDSSYFSPEVLAGLSTYAAATKDLSTEYGKDSLKIASETYPLYDEFYNCYPLSPEFGWVSIAGIELYKATGKSEYLESAKKRISRTAKEILKLNGENNNVNTSSMEVPGIGFVWAVGMYASEFPDDKLATLCRKAWEKVCKHLLKYTDGPLKYTYFKSPFEEDSRYYASPARHCPFLMACAAHLGLGSRLLNKSEWLKIAEKDLQYAWGRNFAGISNMAKVGNKWNSQFTLLQAIPGHENGIMPGSVFKGHGIGRGEFWKKSNSNYASMPTGFPHGILPNSYCTLHQTANNEVWGFCNSLFLVAVMEISEAINWKNKQKRTGKTK